MRAMQTPSTLGSLGAARQLLWLPIWLAGCAGALCGQEAALLVTVFDERTGETVTGLGHDRFTIRDGTTPLQVVSVDEPRGPVDVLLLTDTSMVGETVRPIADALIEELGKDDSMALVGYDEHAELLQDFTTEKRFIREALERARYGGLPRVHDALFAALDGGFDASANRKAVILLSNGAVARSRVSEAEVLDVARAKRVSVYSVFVRTDARSLLRRFALRTGGACFAARRLKLQPRELAKRVFDAVRSPYELTVTGVYTLGDRIETTVSPDGGKRKLSASVLAVD